MTGKIDVGALGVEDVFGWAELASTVIVERVALQPGLLPQISSAVGHLGLS